MATIFAILLGLIVLFAWSFWSEATAIESRAAIAHRTYQEADDAITNIRANVYRAALTARDSAMATKQPAAAASELNALRSKSESEVKRLQTLLGPAQTGSLATLQHLLGSYWNSLISSKAPIENALRAAPSRRGELREAVLTIAEEIDALNEASIQQQELEIANNRKALRRFASQATLALLVTGLVVAFSGIYYLARLERRSERERQRAEGAEIQLRHLSRQLVTAQEEERKTISRELHDEVGQILTGLRMELGTVSLASNPEIFAQRIASIKTLAENALRSVRNLSLLLRPSMLDDLGLGAALQWQAKEFSRRLGIPITVEVSGNLNGLSEPQRICLYRVVQEALTNSARHARASHLAIKIDQSPEAIQARVQDDGIGFHAENCGRGLGLTGMEERVRALGGSLVISSQPGHGATLHATLPIEFEQSV